MASWTMTFGRVEVRAALRASHDAHQSRLHHEGMDDARAAALLDDHFLATGWARLVAWLQWRLAVGANAREQGIAVGA